MADLPVADDFIAPTVTEEQFKSALKLLVENVSSKADVRSTAASLSSFGCWLTESSKRDVAALIPTSNKYLAAKAIKKIAITNPIAGKQYKLSTVFKNATDSRIVVSDDTGAVASIVIPSTTTVAGQQEYMLTGTRAGKVLIDWDVLTGSVTASALDLTIDNTIFYQEFVNTANIASNTTTIAAIKPLVLPQWIVASQADAILNSTDAVKTVCTAIKGVTIGNAVENQYLRLATVAKQDATFGSRFLITNESGVVVLQYVVSSATIKTGLETVPLTPMNSSGLAGKITVNWDDMPSGLSISGSAVILIKWNAIDLAAANTAVAAISASVIKLNKLIAPSWLDTAQTDAFFTLNATIQQSATAIKGAEISGASAGTVLRLSTAAKNDASFATRFIVVNHSTGAIVARYDASNSIVKKGLEQVTLAQVSSSGISLKLTVDWDDMPSGLSISGNYPLYFNLNARDYAAAKLTSDKNSIDISALQSAIGSVAGTSKVATKPYRVAIAGSSITWGQGYLGEASYVGIVEQILRNQYAKTIHASAIAPNATTINGNDFYQGSIKRISGLNTEVSFNSDGDELSLSIARERENTGACNVELYADGVLYDTFNTANTVSVTRTENFTGDGAVIKFNLDGCFTYNHAVTVDGVAKSGSVNTQSTGASIPAPDDYMVVRRYDTAANRVVHALWFKTAPVGAVVVTYKQGENIRHLRGTIDRVGAGFTTALESAYGDGATSYDPTSPSAVSSGFGFRQSDDRSVKTWKFSDSKSRVYKLKIKSLHTSATGVTPYLDLNFATNRMHHIQNAGIGGWSAGELISNTIKLNSVDEVINFNPDIVLIESCTNDDAITGLYKAHVVKTGLTAAQILAEPTANYFTAITGTSPNKTVNDVRLAMTAIDSTSITLAVGVVDTNIAIGDAVVIGSYGGNHKRVAVRTVKAYDSGTRKITLNRSISAADFYQVDSLNDLLSEFVMIYSAPTWTLQVKQLVDVIWSALPDCKVNIATAGVPHYYLRKLFGYRELGQQAAKDKGVGFVDYYNATFDYQYTQPLITHQTITATGAASYALTGGGNTFPNPQVFVDGIEHKKCRVVGGLSKHWAAGITDPTLANTSNATKSFVLIFDANVPVNGATIVVQKSAIAWAADYCHPTGPQGFYVLGQVAAKILKDVS